VATVETLSAGAGAARTRLRTDFDDLKRRLEVLLILPVTARPVLPRLEGRRENSVAPDDAFIEAPEQDIVSPVPGPGSAVRE
jgi:hypothetical protein